MADPTAAPPKPPTPKSAGKGLAGVFKGKPAWVWIAGITVLIGVAYIARRRSQAAADVTPSVVDNTSGSVGDGSLYPSASQGAWGGYSDPGLSSGDGSGGSFTDDPTQPSIIINVPGPQDTSGVGSTFDPPAGATSSDITGGGTHSPAGVAQHQPVQPTALQRAAATIKLVQSGNPSHLASAAQQKAQAAAAASPNINTQDSGSRSGLNYKVVVKGQPKKVYYYYESKPGKGDWGNGGKVYKRKAS